MTRVVLRVEFDDEHYIGPGRVRLLELIGELGSIAQAAKAMDMSYKRAWYLLEAFGACFGAPLVVRQLGGKGGGSAQVTPLGLEVVARYRSMEQLSRAAMDKEIAALSRHLAAPVKTPKRKRTSPKRAVT
jgi:molybdate transport system regulatory protein